MHGPWIKLGGRDRKLAEVPPEELVDAATEKESDIQSESATPKPISEPAAAKKRPRKLEIRSGQEMRVDTVSEDRPPDASRKAKPRKLEVRSRSNGDTD